MKRLLIGMVSLCCLFSSTVALDEMVKVTALNSLIQRVDKIESRFNVLIDSALKSKASLDVSVAAFDKTFKALKTDYATIAPSIAAIGFKPVSALLQSIVDLAEKVFPVNDYFAKIQRVIDAVTVILNKINTEVDVLKSKKDSYEAERAKYKVIEDAARTLVKEGSQKGLEVPAPYFTLIDDIEKKLTEIEGQWKDVASILTVVVDKLQEFSCMMKKDPKKPSCKDAPLEISSYIAMITTKMADIKGYLSSAGLDKASFIPGVLEISDIKINEQGLTPIRKLNEEKIKAFETYAAQFKSILDVQKIAEYISPIVDDFKGIASDTSASLTKDIDNFKKINLTNTRISGRAFELVSFENGKLYEFTDKAVRCLGEYVEIPQLKIDFLPLFALNNVKYFHTTCSLMKIGEFNDVVLNQAFGADTAIMPGNYIKANVDFSPLKNVVSKVPVLSDIFGVLPSSIPMEGYITPKTNLFSATHLKGNVQQSVKIPEIGELQFKSIGISIVDGAAPKTVKMVIPVNGVIDLKLAENFKPVFDTTVVIDPSAGNAVLSGVWKGEWNILGTGIKISDLGLAAALGVGGVTGVGVTGNAKLGEKNLAFTSYGNLSGADVAMIGELKGGLSLKEIFDSLGSTLKIETLTNSLYKVVPAELKVSEAKVMIVPKAMVVFGETYEQGVTVTGQATLLGKKCSLFINVRDNGLFGKLEFEDVTFALGGVQFIKISALKSGEPLSFAIDIDPEKTAPVGLYTDAKVECSPQVFGGFAAQGRVDIALARFSIKDLKATILGLGQATIDAQAGYSLSELPKDWKFKATVGGAGALKDVLNIELSSALKLVNNKPVFDIDASFDNKLFSYLSDQVDETLKTTGKELTGALKTAADTVQKSDVLIDALDKQIEQLKKDIAELYDKSLVGQGGKLITAGINEIGKAAEAIGIDVGQINQGIDASKSAIKKLGKEIENLGKEIAKIAKEIENLAKQVGQGIVDLFSGKDPVKEAKKRKEKKEEAKKEKQKDKAAEEAYQKSLEAKKKKQEKNQKTLKSLEQKLADLQMNKEVLSPFAQVLVQDMQSNRAAYKKLDEDLKRLGSGFSNFGQKIVIEKNKESLDISLMVIVNNLLEELSFMDRIHTLEKNIEKINNARKVLSDKGQELLKQFPAMLQRVTEIKMQFKEAVGVGEVSLKVLEKMAESEKVVESILKATNKGIFKPAAKVATSDSPIQKKIELIKEFNKQIKPLLHFIEQLEKEVAVSMKDLGGVI